MRVSKELIQTIDAIRQTMIQNGLWKAASPEWVWHFDGKEAPCAQSFAEWLQFIYLPNKMMAMQHLQKEPAVGNAVMLQALHHLPKGTLPEALVTMLIELDNI